MNPLFKTISEAGTLSNELIEDINKCLIHLNFKKKDLVLREGEICNHLYFVNEGLLRAYYIIDGSDVSSLFMEKGDFVMSVLSFLKRQPSYEFIEALEDCKLSGFHYDDLTALYAKHVEFNIAGRKLTEAYFCLSEERLVALRKRTAKEKYEYLMNKHPNLVKRVPLKDLASYLGLTPETLSRMRNSVR